MVKPVMPYYGGKARAGLNAWICEHLPYEPNGTYVETHGGMLSVLLARPKVKVEIANDFSERVHNWYQVLRESKDELKQLLLYTPHHESVLKECRARLDDPDPVRRAWAFSVVLCLSPFQCDGLLTGFSYTGMGRSHNKIDLAIARLDAVADRLRQVCFFNRPAVDVLEKCERWPHAVVYVDPPYRDAYTKAYAFNRADRDKTLELLKASRARVAVSGYNDEWDELDWERHEMPIKQVPLSGRSTSRIEVLWTNY